MITLLFLLTVTVFVLFSLLPGDPARLTAARSARRRSSQANSHASARHPARRAVHAVFISGHLLRADVLADSPQADRVRRRRASATRTTGTRGPDADRAAAPVTFWLAIGAFIIWIDRRASRSASSPRSSAAAGRTGSSWAVAGRLLVAVVLHRPAAVLLRHHVQWKLLPLPQYVVAIRGTRCSSCRR